MDNTTKKSKRTQKAFEQAEIKHYTSLTLEKVEEALLELEHKTSFKKVEDNLYRYQYGDYVVLGTEEFFNEVDNKMKEELKK